MNGICCFCGHRDIYENIDNQLRTEIGNAINNGIKTFYSGGMGMFDSKCENIVREYKQGNKDISLILVSPYFIQKFNTEKEWYKTRYDDIIIPDLGNVHYKQAINKRNQWLAEQSDVIIAYVIRKYGGAFAMYKYALKRQIKVINLGKTEL